MGIHHIDARAFSSAVDTQNGPGRPDRIVQVMSHHPQYLDIYMKSQSFIMRGDGPLPFPYRHYIAIMAAGRHQCSYLIDQQVNEFLAQGGDERWLQGLHRIPAKLRDLYEINKILAHRPWLITKDHIERLTTGSDSWSLGELVHALVIVAHYHALSSFVFGCGIGDGEDEPPCHSGTNSPVQVRTPTSVSPIHAPHLGHHYQHHQGNHLHHNHHNMHHHHNNNNNNHHHHHYHHNNQRYCDDVVTPTGQTTPTSLPLASTAPAAAASAPLFVSGSNPGSRGSSTRGSSPDSKGHSRGGSPPMSGALGGAAEEVGLDALMKRMKSLSERREEFSAEEQTKRYEHVESQSAELGVNGVYGCQPVLRPKAEISQFIEDAEFIYQDFARRGETSLIPTFRVQDYSWDDHAFSLINRLYNDVGNLIDDKFRLTYHLTYYTMGSVKDVDTSRFRRAIWNYIQCMFGIRHDDYDYGEVNQLLERSLKTYIKTVVCFPERATRKDYDNILKEFRHSEKIHVNLMLLEARVQAELLYSLRAIMRHMT